MDNVSIQPEGHTDKTGASLETGKPYQGFTASSYAEHNGFSPEIETYSPLQFKYAILMNTAVEELNNQKLLNFIDDWYGTRYRYGGNSKEGIDCSAFVSSLEAIVYGVVNLPRISKDQYEVCRHINSDDLQEGDLVFFHTMGRRKTVTHVGVYLRNHKFIHASISGVMISSMEDGYYAKHFIGGGRAVGI